MIAVRMVAVTSFQEDNEAVQLACGAEIFAEHKSGAASGGFFPRKAFFAHLFFTKKSVIRGYVRYFRIAERRHEEKV